MPTKKDALKAKDNRKPERIIAELLRYKNDPMVNLEDVERTAAAQVSALYFAANLMRKKLAQYGTTVAKAASDYGQNFFYLPCLAHYICNVNPSEPPEVVNEYSDPFKPQLPTKHLLSLHL